MIPTPSGRSRSGLRRYRLATVLEEIMGTPDKAIPNSVLAKAEGIAVFPPTVKGGFIFGAHRGQTRGQILVTSVLEGDGALWRLCPGDPRLRRPMFYPTELLAPAVCAEQSITGTGRGRQWWR